MLYLLAKSHIAVDLVYVGQEGNVDVGSGDMDVNDVSGRKGESDSVSRGSDNVAVFQREVKFFVQQVLIRRVNVFKHVSVLVLVILVVDSARLLVVELVDNVVGLLESVDQRNRKHADLLHSYLRNIVWSLDHLGWILGIQRMPDQLVILIKPRLSLRLLVSLLDSLVNVWLVVRVVHVDAWKTVVVV